MRKNAGKHLGEHFTGYFLKKNLSLATVGALSALAVIGVGKASQKLRPALVGVVKEGYAFKEWAAGRVEKARENAEDITAEAIYAYHKELETTGDAIKKEKEILDKIEKTVEQKLAKRKPGKEEK
ncbi:MAG: hypothetical protein KGZ93_07340 [Actinobacteria bacterium]|nr:hypothetical protein [Actinomycetota bacterium]